MKIKRIAGLLFILFGINNITPLLSQTPDGIITLKDSIPPRQINIEALKSVTAPVLSDTVIIRGAINSGDYLQPGIKTVLENEDFRFDSEIYERKGHITRLHLMVADSAGHSSMIRKSDGKELYRLNEVLVNLRPLWIFKDGSICFSGYKSVVIIEEGKLNQIPVKINGNSEWEAIAANEQGLFFQKGTYGTNKPIHFLSWKNFKNKKWRKSVLCTPGSGVENCRHRGTGRYILSKDFFYTSLATKVWKFDIKRQTIEAINLRDHLTQNQLFGFRLFANYKSGFLFHANNHRYAYNETTKKVMLLNKNHDDFDRRRYDLPDSLHLVMTKPTGALVQNSDNHRIYHAPINEQTQQIQVNKLQLVSDATGIPAQQTGKIRQFVYWDDEIITLLRQGRLVIYNLKNKRLKSFALDKTAFAPDLSSIIFCDGDLLYLSQPGRGPGSYKIKSELIPIFTN